MLMRSCVSRSREHGELKETKETWGYLESLARLVSFTTHEESLSAAGFLKDLVPTSLIGVCKM